ncbi:hypothetical protein GH714_036346 [Hevea brasiliensis]|uniref:Plastocyanin-like domain-containing protein n=1 Tax=Hevea brasiliensis TaxID=3981 RepID=A0A6A6KVP4_HEVBR|nr:hypothetical protein GH714_036346 [Hevea brasiliensis]
MTRILIIFQVSILWVSIDVPPAEARIHNYTWEISYQYKFLDCYKKLSIAINGMTPGPAIDAVQGDTIIVNVINNLVMENVAIHWHGIRQIGTQWSDGTDGVTQCATMPGDTFTYKFVVDRAGTYMYHSHYGMQRESGLYGIIRVSLPNRQPEPFPFPYDYDRDIILSDWYHHNPYEQATNLSSIPFQWVGEPQGHNMTVVEADGTYELLGYHNVVSRKPATPDGLAIFNYYPNHFHKLPPTVPPPGPLWNDTDSRINQSLAIKALQGHVESPPKTSDRVIVLLNTQNTIDGKYRWSLNNVSHSLPTTPYLIALKENMSDVFDQTPPPENYNPDYDISMLRITQMPLLVHPFTGSYLTPQWIYTSKCQHHDEE